VRVLHVINGLGTGGAERSLQEMLPFFEAAGVRSEVAVFHRREHGVEQAVLGAGTPVHFLLEPSWRGRIRALRRVIRSVQPDLVHSSLFDADLCARMACLGTRVPVATSLVNTSWDSSRARDPRVNQRKVEIARRVDGFTARRLSAGFHAISPAVRDDAIATMKLDPASIEVIPRGRSRDRLGTWTPARRSAARAALGLTDGDQVLLNIGRREFQKGQDVLLQALKLLLPSYPRAVLLIAGREGNVSEELDRLVAELGLQAHVRFLGHTDEVPDLLCACDLFVFPSRFEGLGGSLIEALALNAPIVASDVPAISYVLGGGTWGTLVPREDPAALAAGVGALLADPTSARARAEAGMGHFEASFRLDSVADRMVAWFRRMAHVA
jgi:glycosyltransferase involved in cell wall biosynthesis